MHGRGVARSRREKVTYPTGCAALDDLLGGGYETGVITLAYGLTGTGKTTFSCYQAIAAMSRRVIDEEGGLPEDAAFIIVDTEGSFDWIRMGQVLNAWRLPAGEIAERIWLFEPTTFEEQHATVTDEVPSVIEREGLRPMLIALDTAIAIYRGIITRTDGRYKAVTIQSYTGKIDLQLQKMRHLAVKYNAVATVTSWPPSPVGAAMGAPRPEVPVLGGRQMGFLSKAIVEIRILDPDLPYRLVVLRKHRSRPGGMCVVKMAEAGLVDVGADEVKRVEALIKREELRERAG